MLFFVTDCLISLKIEVALTGGSCHKSSIEKISIPPCGVFSL